MNETDNHDGRDKNDLFFFQLRLYIAGASSISLRAVRNLNEFLEGELKGNYDLEVIDIRQQPALAITENITALPVLVKYEPLPKKLLIGDMSDPVRIKRGLGLA
jgi:circadian clock protein KaiB